MGEGEKTERINKWKGKEGERTEKIKWKGKEEERTERIKKQKGERGRKDIKDKEVKRERERC